MYQSQMRLKIKNPNRTLPGLMIALATFASLAQAASSNTAVPGNPLATTDQTEVTATALRVLDYPEIRKARNTVVLRWKAVLQNDPPQEAWNSFESSIDDYTFNYVLKAAASDANYPKVVHIYTPPHEWRGMKVPGSRWGGDNPDNVYRIIPIDGKARFRLDGRRIGNGPSFVSYTLTGNYETMKTLNNLESKDVQVRPDGTFSITLDPQPANGRVNHIQTKPGALFLFIRDSLGDWKQRANALTIHRLDPPDAPPLTDQQIADRAADIMVEGVAPVYWVLKMVHGTPNVTPPLHHAGTVGGLVTQRNSTGEARLNDDEALMVTVNPAGAAYFSLVGQNYWFITIDYGRLTGSLNSGQSIANRDGTYTYVVSVKDPGVHNWLDTGGLHNVLVQLRLQGLPDKLPSEPAVQWKLVKLADLKQSLPKETVWVTAEQRSRQRQQRQLEYQARMADH